MKIHNDRVPKRPPPLRKLPRGRAGVASEPDEEFEVPQYLQSELERPKDIDHSEKDTSQENADQEERFGRWKALLKRRAKVGSSSSQSKDEFGVKSEAAHEAAKITGLNALRSREPPPGAAKLLDPPQPPGTDAFAAMKNSQPPGVFWKKREASADDAELLAAVEDVRRATEGVAGVAEVFPGSDELASPIVIVSIVRGFVAASLELIPPKARGFDVVLTIPYTLLPLRREKPKAASASSDPTVKNPLGMRKPEKPKGASASSAPTVPDPLGIGKPEKPKVASIRSDPTVPDPLEIGKPEKPKVASIRSDPTVPDPLEIGKHK